MELAGVRTALAGDSTLQPFNASTSVASIEVGPTELPRLLKDDLQKAVSAALLEIGYAKVTVDWRGYRRGSLNELAAKAILPH